MYTFLHYLTLSFVLSYQLRCPLSTFPALPFLCPISDAHIVSQVFCTACEASRFMLTNFHIFHPSSARASYSDLCSVPSSSNECFKAPHLRLLHFFTYLPCCFCGCTLNFLSATNTFSHMWKHIEKNCSHDVQHHQPRKHCTKLAPLVILLSMFALAITNF